MAKQTKHTNEDRERTVPPKRCRLIRAKMVEKHVSLKRVAALAGIPYVVASDLLRGYRVAPKKLAQLSAAVNQLPEPAEAA